MATHSSIFFLENPHGQRSLVGYSPWGRKELAMTEGQTFAVFFPPTLNGAWNKKCLGSGSML